METMVSIIMAAYNAERTIHTAIESVISQTYINWELLVVDDCSVDNTLEIVQRYAKNEERIRVIHNDRNSGVSQSRKNALCYAAGDWIAVLDSDDMWVPEKLEKQMAVAKSKNAVLIYTGSNFIREDGSRIAWQLHVPERVTFKELLKQNVISNSSVMIRKCLYECYYVVGDHLHEDYAMWLRVLAGNVVACGIDEPLLIYRVAATSKSGNKIKSAKMQYATYRYIGLSLPECMGYMFCYALKGFLKYRHLR